MKIKAPLFLAFALAASTASASTCSRYFGEELGFDPVRVQATARREARAIFYQRNGFNYESLMWPSAANREEFESIYRAAYLRQQSMALDYLSEI